ncbi:hypothetical protein RHMOL_Rhmol01G0003500 [Rhododendron molle]|uniref:Uncharacterized protein n=1 Tax=Rhododendron molle TaxID=49168 RepID=A0ACC0PZ51_RHOML|nr:hypothetical protein RHMOL_Rhmol01G0003500 [Rhododendron molle]
MEEGRHRPSFYIMLYVCASSNEAIAKLKDVGTRITNEIKRDIGQQWKNLSNEDRQKYKHLAKLAKEDLAKQKALLPPKPKKVEGKVIDLEVNMSDEFSQLCENIGMTKGVVQLKELREYLDETEEVGDVFKRKFALYMLGCFLCPTTKACVTRSFMNGVSDVVGMGNQNWANLTLDFLCKGIQEQCDKYLVQPNGCLFLLVVFYFDRVSPSPKVMFYVRKFPTLVNWGDIEIKNILHEFDKIGGYDSEGVVVNFTLDEGTKVDENTSGNEAGVSQILPGDVSVMTSTLITIASLLLHQNMILGKHFGSGMLSDLEAQTAQEMDLKHGHEGPSSHLLTQLTGLHTCQTSSVKEFETHDPMVNQAKGVEANPTQARHLALEMLSKPQQQEQPPPQMAQQMDRNQSVILQVESSPLFTGVHTCETSTPNELKTPDYALNKSKAVYDMPTSCFDQYNTGIEMDMDEDEDVVSPSPVSGLKSLAGSSRGIDTRKRKIQQDVDEVVGSPSPVSAFKSQAGLSRGRKKQLAFGKPVMSFCDEPRRLRERAKLKKSQFQRSPFTKDGLKKRNLPKNKNQPKTQSNNIADQHQIVENIDINVPTFRGVYGKMKSLKFADAMQELNPQSKIINLVAVQMTNDERSNHPDKRHFMWYLPVMVSRQILNNPNLNDSDLTKLCDSYFGDANFTADLSSCSMIYIPTNNRGNHWFCIKVDLGIQMAYIFYSKPATRSNLFRKRPCFTMDDTERPRLLMGLLVDPNNRERDTVVKKFDDWKAKKGQTGFVYAGGHLLSIVEGKCLLPALITGVLTGKSLRVLFMTQQHQTAIVGCGHPCGLLDLPPKTRGACTILVQKQEWKGASTLSGVCPYPGKVMRWDLLMDMMMDFMDTLKLVRITEPMLLSFKQRLICSNSAFGS